MTQSVSPRGNDFQSEQERIELQVMKIRSSWSTSGCSVLVDGWRGAQGRDLINFLVDCPKGPVYLRTLDISAKIEDSDALLVVVGEIVDEVGADNVVQIISNDTPPCMKDVGELFMKKHPGIFWTVSSSHCLELMLEKIAKMDSIERILNKARALTKFIYSRTTVLHLMRRFTSSNDLVRSTKVRSLMPFLTLENVVSEKENLQEMFASSVWSSSVLASSMGGRRIADLVGDASFWSEANEVLKGTIPLVSAFCSIHESAEPQLGFIYETMDRAKESIQNNMNKVEDQYRPYWDAIDELWDGCLHSHLHSAAFFLNPRFRYSPNFYTDTVTDKEVSTGLYSCISNMVKEKKVLELVWEQVGLYKRKSGPFSRSEAINWSSLISPAEWWIRYGKICPELQSLAIRILGQTCDGASKYYLDRGWAEKVLTEERDETEQQQLMNLTFLHYNAELEEFKPNSSNHYCEIDPMDDWVVDETMLNGEPVPVDPVGSSTSTRKQTLRSTRRRR